MPASPSVRFPSTPRIKQQGSASNPHARSYPSSPRPSDFTDTSELAQTFAWDRPQCGGFETRYAHTLHGELHDSVLGPESSFCYGDSKASVEATGIRGNSKATRSRRGRRRREKRRETALNEDENSLTEVAGKQMESVQKHEYTTHQELERDLDSSNAQFLTDTNTLAQRRTSRQSQHCNVSGSEDNEKSLTRRGRLSWSHLGNMSWTQFSHQQRGGLDTIDWGVGAIPPTETFKKVGLINSSNSAPGGDKPSEGKDSNTLVDGSEKSSGTTEAAFLDLTGLKIYEYVAYTQSSPNEAWALEREDPFVDMERFLELLESKGILRDDPRLGEMMERMRSEDEEALTVVVEENEDPNGHLCDSPSPEGETSNISLNETVASLNQMFFSKSRFLYTISPALDLLEPTLTDELIIPDFPAFKKDIENIFEDIQANIPSSLGKVADYIPQLARSDPEMWGVAVCTVDGQRASFGDAKEEFCLQSCSKPATYAMVLEEHGAEVVHQHVGREPSGSVFNALILNPQGRPHNPLINAGAIMTSSLLLVSEKEAVLERERGESGETEEMSRTNSVNLLGGLGGGSEDNIDSTGSQAKAMLSGLGKISDTNVMLNRKLKDKARLPVESALTRTRDMWSRLAGGAPIGYDDSVFWSELETADRNFSLAYFMNEFRAFPEEISGRNLKDVLSYYFRTCALTLTAEALSVAAATLANGGICPLTGEQILSQSTVKNTLSLMFSCGMYDYSGEFAFSIGLPAKSGVAGGVFAVVPNLLGFATYSPPLDSYGNSVKGVEFLTRVTKCFSFHLLDHIAMERDEEDHLSGGGGMSCVDNLGLQKEEEVTELPSENTSSSKKDPRKKYDRHFQELDATRVIALAARGDLAGLRRLRLRTTPSRRGDWVSKPDYDGRTPLHLAASNGHLQVCKWLVGVGHCLTGRDRWGNGPLDDAIREGEKEIEDFLRSVGFVTK